MDVLLMVKVLIVDDDRNVGKCLRQLIDWRDLDYEIVGEAYDGDAAYKEALEKRPDVIITDIKMPFSDGTALAQKIRESMSNVEIIFLSGYEDFSAAQIALKYGVKEYILKPIDMRKINQLTAVLRQIKVSLEQRDVYQRLLSGTNTDTDLLNALKISDSDFFTDFFDTLMEGSSGDFAFIRTLCHKLINILYDYLRYIGTNESMIDKKRMEIEEEIKQLKMAKDLVFYTRKLYFEVIHLKTSNRDDYHQSMISEIKECIRDNYYQKSFNVSYVAGKFNFSIDYIGKLFKQYTGTSISAYITEVRLEKAAELLRDTMLSINDIADMVGYSTSGHFIKVFKGVEIMTPLEYRMKAKLNKQQFSSEIEDGYNQ